MSFLHVGLLSAGLAAVSIPIIIHLLFRQRRRPVEWAAMRFLLEAFRKQRRKLQVQQWLLLAVRCLVIACVALALGRPLLRAAGLMGPSGGRDVYLVVDNSLASSLREGEGTEVALDRHKRAAEDVLSSLGAGDRAGLVTLGGPAEATVVPASSDIGAVRRLIGEIETTDSKADVAGALSALGDRLDQEGDARAGRTAAVVVLSDFLRGSADLSLPLSRSLSGVEGVRVLASRPRQASAGNVQVVGVDPLSGVVLTGAGERTRDLQVPVRLRRTGSAVGESGLTTVRVTVMGGGTREAGSAQGVVRWSPGQSEANTSVVVRTDRVSGEEGTGVSGAGSSFAVIVAEIDRDGIDGDNRMGRPVRVTDALDVGVVGQRRFGAGARVDRLPAAEWLRLALRPSVDTPLETVDIEPSGLVAPVLAALDAVFVPSPELVPAEAWGKIRRFVDAGGVLVVSPGEGGGVQLWSDAFEAAMGTGWTISREPVEHGEGGIALVGGARGAGLLGVIERGEELERLIEPIRVTRSVPVEGAGEDDVVLRLSDGTAWLVAGRAGQDEGRGSRGMVVYMASAPVLSWTDLPARPLMVPLVQEMVKQGVGRAGSSLVTAAGSGAYVGRGVVRVEAMGEGGATYEVGPRGMAEGIREAGVLGLRDETGRGVGVLVVNADVSGGLTEAQDPGAVGTWLGEAVGAGEDGVGAEITWLEGESPGAALAGEETSSPIGLPLLIAALVLGVLEIFMARWFSHAFREDAGPGLVAAGGAG